MRTCAILLAWSLPAAVVGVAILRSLDAVTLQVAVTVGVAATLAARRMTRAPHGPAPRWAAPVTGLAAGALVTSTNTSGPPLLLYLLGRGDAPALVRDTLTVCQLGLSVIGALAIALTGTSGAVPDAGRIAVFVPLVLRRPPRRPAAVRAPGGERALRAGADRHPRARGRHRAGDRRARGGPRAHRAVRDAIGLRETRRSDDGPGSR